MSPSEVRKQSGDYGKALADHEQKYKQDLGTVQRWREALVQVAGISGWDVQNKYVIFSKFDDYICVISYLHLMS